ncbi:hypothetical protein Ct61P_01589 [Colletotrichum tofieldiae]|nr:hypothetical protein Ct61P_01589 [Colletotrichum tofieldiae]
MEAPTHSTKQSDWGDCCDFGVRVEFLGVGRWASKKAEPFWERHELAGSLKEVILSSIAEDIQNTTFLIAKRHPEGAGRENAAGAILKLLDNVRL